MSCEIWWAMPFLPLYPFHTLMSCPPFSHMPFQSLVFPIIITLCCLIFLSLMLKHSSHPSAFSLAISCSELLSSFLPYSFLIPFFRPSYGHFCTYTLTAAEESLDTFHIWATAHLTFPVYDWPWLLKIQTFWNVILCCLVSTYQHFRGVCHLCLQGLSSSRTRNITVLQIFISPTAKISDLELAAIYTYIVDAESDALLTVHVNCSQRICNMF